jgi:hypothetical protein
MPNRRAHAIAERERYFAAQLALPVIGEPAPTNEDDLRRAARRYAGARAQQLVLTRRVFALKRKPS